MAIDIVIGAGEGNDNYNGLGHNVHWRHLVISGGLFQYMRVVHKTTASGPTVTNPYTALINLAAPSAEDSHDRKAFRRDAVHGVQEGWFLFAKDHGSNPSPDWTEITLYQSDGASVFHERYNWSTQTWGPAAGLPDAVWLHQ